MLENKIMEIYNKGKIEFELEDASSNLALMTIEISYSKTLNETITLDLLIPLFFLQLKKRVSNAKKNRGSARS